MYSLIVACVAYKVHPDRICYKQEIWRRESMDTVTAVRNRILALCGEREITINKLATISALPPSSIKNILYGKSQNRVLPEPEPPMIITFLFRAVTGFLGRLSMVRNSVCVRITFCWKSGLI